MKKNGYAVIGYLLLAAFLLQEVMDIRWEYLRQFQQEEGYRRWSGVFLAVFLLFQWMLTLVRSVRRWEPSTLLFLNIHKWAGALSPLAFYIHSMKLGFAYLFVLSTVFFSNHLLGLVNTDLLKMRTDWYMQGWMILHVAFSLLISLLMVFHIWIVFYYE